MEFIRLSSIDDDMKKLFMEKTPRREVVEEEVVHMEEEVERVGG